MDLKLTKDYFTYVHSKQLDEEVISPRLLDWGFPGGFTSGLFSLQGSQRAFIYCFLIRRVSVILSSRK